MSSLKNRMVAFSNQKGGVGKTTLCTLFANYLSSKGINVHVIDADFQQSITEQRYHDLMKRGGDQEDVKWKMDTLDLVQPDDKPWNVFIKEIDQMLETASALPGCVLFDTPGNLSVGGLSVIYPRMDYIICPFFYDSSSLASTGKFIQVMNDFREIDPNMDAKLIFIPNNVRKGVGKSEELVTWGKINKIFEKHGKVTPKIEQRACIQRFSTMDITREQLEAVENCFKFIAKQLYPKQFK